MKKKLAILLLAALLVHRARPRVVLVTHQCFRHRPSGGRDHLVVHPKLGDQKQRCRAAADLHRHLARSLGIRKQQHHLRLQVVLLQLVKRVTDEESERFIPKILREMNDE